jgi:tRNA threonylcarbamoyladenosine biosynthesis protein TsaE
MTKLICRTIDELPAIAHQLLPEIISSRFVAFEAPMGAGKTTTIKSICISLGVHENEIHSPTYSLVNEYQGKDHLIYHFDFYRLNTISEAYDFGLEEYFQKDAICLMEWPSIIESLIPLPYLKIRIDAQENERIIETEIINF